jgi:branched-chain amino acid transport system substrate-binding protein
MGTGTVRNRALLLLCVFALVAVGCSSDKKTTTGASGSSSSSGQAKSLLPNNGPCDKAKQPYPVGIITVFESAVLSLKDQVTALDASVKAFNARGGIGGHCMNLETCDDKADPNLEVDCARKLIGDGVVATLNDTTSFNPQPVADLFTQAGIARVGDSPNVPELSSPSTYAIGAGGTGTTFMMVPACTRNGHKKIAAIHVDTPQIGPLFDALAPMIKAYGAELVAKLPVTAGTTDFQQFTLAAQKAGADCAIIPLGQNEAVQVLQAAQQVGTKMTFSGSLGTFGRGDIAKFGDFASQLYFNAELPPVTGDQKRWPILADIIRDLSASGDPALQADTIKSSPVRSWVAVYSLVTIVEKFGTPDNVSKQAVKAAMDAAKDVDHFGLIPPWTPNLTIAPGAFSRISNPWYYVMTWDSSAKQFKVLDKQFNVLAELGGQLDYPQPTQTPGGSTTTSAGGGGGGSTSSSLAN